MIILYTFPYAFDTFTYSDQCLSKSSCPNEKDYYGHMIVYVYLDMSEKTNVYWKNRFHIHHLVTPFPCNTNFLSCISSFNQFVSLGLSISNDSAYSQLENLLNGLRHLDSLTLISFLKKEFQVTCFRLASY